MSARPASAARQPHWDSIYVDADPDELRWHEPTPSTLPLVLAHSGPTDAVIDVGGGFSRLAATLLDRGYTDVTVLDVSEAALMHARRGLGQRADAPVWLHADVTEFEPPRRWDLWHDRAVFHFLVDERDRSAYRRAAGAGVVPGGTLVVATFAPDGPEMCAGLPVRRYDEDALADEFDSGFELLDGRAIEPIVGVGDQRPYVAVALRRRD